MYHVHIIIYMHVHVHTRLWKFEIACTCTYHVRTWFRHVCTGLTIYASLRWVGFQMMIWILADLRYSRWQESRCFMYMVHTSLWICIHIYMYVHGTYMFMNVPYMYEHGTETYVHLHSHTSLLIRPDLQCLQAGSAPAEQPPSFHQDVFCRMDMYSVM